MHKIRFRMGLRQTRWMSLQYSSRFPSEILEVLFLTRRDEEGGGKRRVKKKEGRKREARKGKGGKGKKGEVRSPQFTFLATPLTAAGINRGLEQILCFRLQWVIFLLTQHPFLWYDHTHQSEFQWQPKGCYHGSHYSAEFIFPDFPVQNESFSWLIYSREIPMSVFNRLQSTRNKGGGTNLKPEVQIICKRREQEKLWTVIRHLCTTVYIFSASLLTFAPWYF